MKKWDFYLKIEDDFLDSTLRQPLIESHEAILYLHGWGGDREVQSVLLNNLCEAGYYVLNFNQRGFLPSTGKRSLAKWHKDASILVEYLIDKGFRVWLCGLSTGGTMGISTMTLNEHVFGGIIISPFASIDQLFKDKPELQNRLYKIFGSFTENDQEAANALLKVDLINPRPLLFICGDADQIIPYKHSKLIKEKAGNNATLITVPNANHIISTISQSVLSDIITEWIAKQKQN